MAGKKIISETTFRYLIAFGFIIFYAILTLTIKQFFPNEKTIIIEGTDSIIEQNNVVKVESFFNSGYTTKIDLSQPKDLEYTPNIHNIEITLSGKLQDLKLNFSANTTILGGSSIKRDVTYYTFFSLYDKIPRIVGTDRLNNGTISTIGEGVFNGLDTPKSFTFDLSKLQLANAKNPPEGAGSKIINSTEFLNLNSGKSVKASLFLGGSGKGQVEPDEKNRIFMNITEAYFSYICSKETPDCVLNVRELK